MATSYIENVKTPEIERVIHTLDAQKLYQADRRILVPFKLTFNNDDILICDEIVRLLPGKRLVGFGTWSERRVALKLFFEKKRAKIHVERELRGIEALESTHTPTPKLLWRGEHDNIQILIFEKLTDAVSLDVLWQNKQNYEELELLLQSIMLELATQHVLGIEQKDLHLKNFLVSRNHIFTIDGGCIIQHPDVMNKEQSITHLALFFAQLGIGCELLQARLFEIYIQARGWLIKKSDAILLCKNIQKFMVKRWQRYEKKLQRNSTQFVRKSNSTSLIMYDRGYFGPELEALLTNPDSFFQGSHITFLKMGNSSTVIKIKLDNQDYVIKRYNVKNIFHWLRRCLRPSRAIKLWTFSQRLRLLGISTPKPIAFIEKRFLGFRGKSYFIMEFSSGMCANQFFAQHRGMEGQLEKTARNIVDLFNNLAKLNLTHGDLKATNILVHENKPLILDFDGMIEHRNKASLKRAFKREIKRFMHNWENMPSVYGLFEGLLNKREKK